MYIMYIVGLCGKRDNYRHTHVHIICIMYRMAECFCVSTTDNANILLLPTYMYVYTCTSYNMYNVWQNVSAFLLPTYYYRHTHVHIFLYNVMYGRMFLRFYVSTTDNANILPTYTCIYGCWFVWAECFCVSTFLLPTSTYMF